MDSGLLWITVHLIGYSFRWSGSRPISCPTTRTSILLVLRMSKSPVNEKSRTRCYQLAPQHYLFFVGAWVAPPPRSYRHVPTTVFAVLARFLTESKRPKEVFHLLVIVMIVMRWEVCWAVDLAAWCGFTRRTLLTNPCQDQRFQSDHVL